MEGQSWKQNVYHVEWSTELNEWMNEWKGKNLLLLWYTYIKDYNKPKVRNERKMIISIP